MIGNRARKAFRPTRSHPHRWCRPLHRTYTFLSAILIIAALIQNPILLAVMLIFSVILAMLVITSKFGPGLHGRVAHESIGAGGLTHTEVSVDRRWATLAVVYDLYLTASCCAGVIVLGLAGSAAFRPDKQTIPQDIGWVLMFVAASFLFGQYAHWRATRPRPRRRARVLVPALLRNH